MKRGIGYLPEDRKQDGIIESLSVRDNIILALQVLNGFFRPFSKKEAEAFADEYIRLLEIKTASPDTPIGSLSGGNQQKAIIAKWVQANCDIIIFDEPTRGIDVGAKAEVYAVMKELADAGKCVIMVSSELPETIGICDRIIVMREGEIMADIVNEKLTEEDIVRYAVAN